jgi:hypothetical protein
MGIDPNNFENEIASLTSEISEEDLENEKLFDERKEYMEFKFGAGAQFIVSKKKILQRPKEFYLKIIEMLDNDINPIEGYVIERFHNLIFNCELKVKS